MKRRLYLFFFIVLSLTFRLSEAAVVSPDLQAVLQSGPSDQAIPVIINFTDKADIGSIKDNDKHTKRTKIVKALKDKADLVQGPLKTLLISRGGKRITPLWIQNAVAATVSSSVISELMSFPGIESIRIDAVIQAPPVIPAAAATPEWNITTINAPALWNAGITGTGVVVASLDTGVDVTHPDLQPRWRGTGTGCDVAVPPSCNSYWFDPYTTSTVPYPSPASPPGHGTGTMGVMVGGSAGGTVIGVAPGAQWISAKIFDDTGQATDTAIHQAFQWVLAPGGDPLNAPDVVNNSWGNSDFSCDTTFQPDIKVLKDAGIAVVFSAGNLGPGVSTSTSPANLVGSLAVGATDFTNTIASFSSRGPSPFLVPAPPSTDAGCDGSTFPHVVAPGENIRVAFPGSLYTNSSGTSFSAPHVAGAMALLLSAFPSLTPAQLETAFEQTAVPLGSPPFPNNNYGHGLIDAEAAYNSIFISLKGDVPQIFGIPSSAVYNNVSAGSSSSSVTFVIVNQGTADLVISPSPLGVSLTGLDPSDYVITNDGCSGVTIVSLGSCSVSVAFNPATSGLKNAVVTIASNATANPISLVSLSGNGQVVRTHDSAPVAAYSSIQAAYNDCLSRDIIEMQAVAFAENPAFDSTSNIAVSLLGGYDPAFGSQAGFTTIQGTLTISRGTVTIGNVIVQ